MQHMQLKSGVLLNNSASYIKILHSLVIWNQKPTQLSSGNSDQSAVSLDKNTNWK